MKRDGSIAFITNDPCQIIVLFVFIVLMHVSLQLFLVNPVMRLKVN